MEQLQKIKSKIATLTTDIHKEPAQESTPINLEILLSESIVESVSVWDGNGESETECKRSFTSEDCNNEWSKRNYDGGFKLTGNSMSLKLDDVEYSTAPEITHFILTGGGGGSKGIFSRHFSDYHKPEQGEMIKNSVIGDIVLNFKAKEGTENAKEGTENVYLVLPIFKTENSNLNGSEILKLAAGIENGNIKQSGKDKGKLESSANKNKVDPMGFNQLQLTKLILTKLIT